MSTVAELIQIAKGQYGLERSATEDDLFTDEVMTDFFNAAHKTFAALGRPYLGQVDLSLTEDTILYALPEKVIEVDVYTVRVRTGTGGADGAGAWTELPFTYRRSLIQKHGAPESWASGTPESFFLMPGSTVNETKRIGIYKPPDSTYLGSPAGTLNLRLDAWIYPEELTTADTPIFPEHEHYRLIPGICRRMAELHRSRGNLNAPVEMYLRSETVEALEFRDIIRRSMEEVPRTGNTSASALEDAHDRRLGLTARRGG
jgi:hypothetical protein